MRWSRTEYVCPNSPIVDFREARSTSNCVTFCNKHTADISKEYELAEEEVKISLDRFRDEYCNPDGSIK